MHFIGLDLAWGGRNPTGVAVLDAAGHLVHLSQQGDDEEILAAVGPYAAGDCVLAVDAPLVVVNAGGNRPGEAALNRDFAPFEAGAHPSNTGLAAFAGGGRAARIAARLRLTVDPGTDAPRRAWEVYPHPATVALFRLGRTVKYKNKPGRSFEQLKGELLRLVGHVEALSAAEVPLVLDDGSGWHELVADVRAATRKSELRRAEDQVDAVLCAYIGLFATRRPERTTVYGDAATGFVVTPTLPADHRPAPRGGADPAASVGHDEVVRRAVREYTDRHPALREVTDRYAHLVTELLDDAGINYLSVTGRTKSVASFAAKAERAVDDRPLYPEPLRDITDTVGVRIVTYLQADLDAAAELLTDQLVVLGDRDMGRETAGQGRFGYASRHLLVRLDDGRRTDPAYAAVGDRVAQVQVRTALQHAWAEFEHAVRYKGSVPEEHAPDLDRRFTLAAGLLELADREFSLIHERLQEASPGPGATLDEDAVDPRISPQELAAFLAGRYPGAGWSRADHYAWMGDLLLELAVTSLDELGALLAELDVDVLDRRMGYRQPPTAVRRLDDALLARFGHRYLALHGNAHRFALLTARLERLTDEQGEPGA